MHKVTFGSIPDKITYTYYGEQSIVVGLLSNYTDPKNTIKVIPVFTSDSNDKNMLSRAKRWAQSSGYYLNSNPLPITSTVVDNKPIKNIKIPSSESNGYGKLYKVLIDQYYINLREDVMMEALCAVGVQPGGILQGEYIWANIRNDVKLIRVNSDLHKSILEYQSKKDMEKISKKELEPGRVYQDIRKNKAIFIGYVNSTRMIPENVPPFHEQRTSTAYFRYTKTAYKKAMLFYYVLPYENPNDIIHKMKDAYPSYSYLIKKSHNYIEALDKLELPDNLVENLRRKTIKEVKELLVEYSGNKPNINKFHKINSWDLQSTIGNKSIQLNMYECGKDPVPIFDIKTLLLFS